MDARCCEHKLNRPAIPDLTPCLTRRSAMPARLLAKMAGRRPERTAAMWIDEWMGSIHSSSSSIGRPDKRRPRGPALLTIIIVHEYYIVQRRLRCVQSGSWPMSRLVDQPGCARFSSCRIHSTTSQVKPSAVRCAHSALTFGLALLGSRCLRGQRSGPTAAIAPIVRSLSRLRVPRGRTDPAVDPPPPRPRSPPPPRPPRRSPTAASASHLAGSSSVLRAPWDMANDRPRAVEPTKPGRLGDRRARFPATPTPALSGRSVLKTTAHLW